MCTPILKFITCYTVKPKQHKCGLHPQMWIIVGKYHNNIYNKQFCRASPLVPPLKIKLLPYLKVDPPQQKNKSHDVTQFPLNYVTSFMNDPLPKG